MGLPVRMGQKKKYGCAFSRKERKQNDGDFYSHEENVEEIGLGKNISPFLLLLIFLKSYKYGAHY